jgi:hypothetical protein
MLSAPKSSVGWISRKIVAAGLAYCFLATSLWSEGFGLDRLPAGPGGSHAVLFWLSRLHSNRQLAKIIESARAHRDRFAASPASDSPTSTAPRIFSNLAELRALEAAQKAATTNFGASFQQTGLTAAPVYAMQSASSSTTTYFWGPQQFLRTTGSPNDYTVTITVPASITSPYNLHIQNGNADGTNRVSSATICINGTQVAGPSDFNQNVATLDRAVTLTAQTTLDVQLASDPGSFLNISLGGQSGDHTAPVVTIAAPAAGSAINTSQAHLDVRYQDVKGAGDPAASGINLNTLHVVLDGTDRTSLFTAQSGEATADLPASLALAQGSHTLTASIQDNAGNTGTATAQFQVDTTPPSMQIVQPAAGSFLNTNTPQIQLAYSDNFALNLSSLKVTINNVDRTSLFTVISSGASTTLSANTALPDGSNQIVATINDQAGNSVSATTSFICDHTPPTINITAPASGARIGSSNVSFTITYSDNQAVDVSSLQVTLDGNALSVTGGASSASGSFTAADGNHTLAASIKDKAGNSASTSSAFSVDTKLPSIQIAQPAASANLNTSTPQIQVQFSDNDLNTASFKAFIDNVDKTSLFIVTASGATATAPALADGPHTIKVQITDLTGNLGTTTNQCVIDTTPPQLTITAPGNYANTVSPTASAQYSDSGSGIDSTSVHVYVDGTEITSNFTITNSSLTGTLSSLSEGSHQFRVKVADKAGNVTDKTASFLVDITPPTAAFAAPANNAFINSTQPALTLTYTDSGSGIDLTSIHIFLQQGSNPETEITSLFTIAAGQASGTIASPLAQATYHLRAQVSDKAGNARSATSTFVVDTTPPAISITTPVSGARFGSASVSFTVQYSDNQALDLTTLQITLDGNALSVTPGASSVSGSFTATDGNHTLAATIKDKAGNSASASSGFSVDTKLPSIQIVQPAANANVNTGTPQVQVQFSDNDLNTASFKAFIDNVDKTSLFTVTASGATATAPLLADGPHTVSAQIADLTGNVGQTSNPFVVDTSKPTAAFIAPVNNAFINNTQPALTLTYSDSGSGVDLTSIHIFLQQGSNPETEITSLFTIAAGQASGTIASPLAQATYHLRAQVADKAGNVQSATSTFVVDTAAPSISITAPAAGARLGSTSVSFAIQYSDNQALDLTTLQVTLDGNALQVTPGASSASGSFTVTDGTHTLTATIKDKAGNAATTASSQFSIDTKLPSIQIVQPAANANLNTGTPQIQVQFSDNDLNISTFKGFIDNVDQTSLFTVTATGATATAALLADGPHTVSAQIADLTGNVGQASNPFVVDTLKPTATFIAPVNNAFINNTQPVLTLTYSDSGSGIDLTSIHIFLQQGSNPETEITSLFTVAASQASGAIPASLPLAQATYHLRAQVADKAGNVQSATSTFTVDTALPAIAITAPVSGSYTNNNKTSIAVTFADSGDGINQGAFKVTIDGVDHTSDLTVTATGASGSLSAALADGPHSVTASVSDNAGNLASTTASFTVDTVAPQFTITQPADGSYSNATAITVSGTVTDSSPVTVTVEGVAAPVQNNAFSASVPLGAGPSQDIHVIVTDAAGNSIPSKITVNIDRVAPTIIATGTPAPNAAGWNNSNVTVGFTCSDSGSGIATCSDPVQVTTETAGQQVTGTAVDKAGNTATSTPVTVKLDKTPPTIIATPASAPNASGWNTMDVVVNFTCSDSLSGIDSCPAPLTVSTDGRNQPVSGTATDKAGNTATSAPLSLNIEKGLPSIAASVNPAPNSAGWNNSAVTVSFACSPAASDIVSCQQPVTVATEGKGQTVTGSVTDQAGKTNSASATVNLDKTAPVVTASAAPPANAAGWNNTDVVVTYTCADSLSGVALCPSGSTVSSEGAAQVITSGPAADVAGNSSPSAIITLSIDKTPPTITATATPAPNAAGWNNGDVTVKFTCADALSGVASCPSVTVVTGEGANLPIAGQAIDNAGNTAVTNSTVNIDRTPPTVILTTPDQVSRLHTGQITVQAQDNISVSQVVISVNGTPVGSFANPPYQAALAVPASANPGDTLTITAVAIDEAGNVGTAAPHGVRVAADGIIVGQVLSDNTSLPLPGASVQVIAANGQSDQTDQEGRYSFPASDPHVFLAAANAGSTTVEREVFVQAGTGTVAVDARLTQLAAAVAINGAGGSLSSGPISVSVPAGAAPDGTTFQLTALSGQGLPGLLPLGWSPLGAFDLRANASASNFTAAISNLPNLVFGLVTYSPALHAWTMVQSGIQAVNGTASFAVPALGAYALVVPDTTDPPIPIPDPGNPLTGIAVQALDPTATSSGSLNPAMLPPSGGTATATLGVQSPSFAPSGTVIQANVSEKFSLSSGDVVSEQVRSEDIVLYNALAPANAAMGALFAVTPSHHYSNQQLLTGKVHLDILAGREGARGQPGGNDPVSVTDGISTISVPGGALGQNTAISVQSFLLEDFVPTSSSMGALQEVLVDFSGETLNTPAQLSISSTGLNPNDTFLLTQVQRINGIPHMVVVALAQVSGSTLTSVASPGLPGVLQGGEYVFYDIPAPVGFVQGVTSSSAGPVPALVQTDSLQIVSISGMDGRFIVPALAGTANLKANAPNTNLAGTATTQVTAGQTVTANIQLAGTVTNATVTPADGSLGVPASTVITITTTAPLNAQSVAQSNLVLVKGTASSGTPVAIQPFVLSTSGTVLSFAPVSNLDPATQYTIQVSGLADMFGSAVIVPTSSFTTKAVATLNFDPNAITFSFPDQNGNIHVSAPAGSLPPGTRVVIVDETNAIVLSLTALNDGSLAGDFLGTINDVLQVSVTDPNGAAANFTRSQFVAADGSVAVGPGGGTVTGPGGVELRIPSGALNQGAVFQIKAVGIEAFPQLPDMPNSHFGGGMQITAPSNPVFQQEAKLAFPKPADAPDGAFYYVYRQLKDQNGNVYFETIDHAFVQGTGANAQVVTASPPFCGYRAPYGNFNTAAANSFDPTFSAVQLTYFIWTIDPNQPGVASPGLIVGKAIQAFRPAPGKIDPTFSAMQGVTVYLDDDPKHVAITNNSCATFAIFDPHLGGGVRKVTAVGPDGTTLHGTANEVNGVQVDDATFFVTAGLELFYQNIGHINFTFPPAPLPAPPPQLTLSLAIRNADGTTTTTGGPVLAGTSLVISAQSNNSDPSQAPTVTGTVQGQPYSVDHSTLVFTPDFTPATPGLYTVTASAVSPFGGDPFVARMTFLVIGAGGSNNQVTNGQAPDVLTAQLVPQPNAVNVPTSIFPQVVFSEPVNNVASNVSLYETDQTGAATNAQVSIKVSGLAVDFDSQGNSSNRAAGTVSDIDNIVSITIQPQQSLKYGTFYKIRLGPGITDLEKDASGNPAPRQLAGTPPSREFVFQTYPLQGLSNTDSFASPRVVVLGNRAYATEVFGDVNSRLLEYNIEDPANPQPVDSQQVIVGRAVDLAGEAAFSQTAQSVVNIKNSSSPGTIGLLGVATGAGVIPLPSNIFFYDVSDGSNVQRIGAVSVTGSASQEGTIMRMVMKGGFAYTVTLQKGVQVVDINQAISNYTAARGNDPRVFAIPITTDGQGFGMDAVVNTIPVMTHKFPNEVVPAALFDLKAADLVLDQQTQNLVLATGVEALTVVDPVAGQIISQLPSLTIQNATNQNNVLDHGYALAVGNINAACPSGVVGNATNCNIAVVVGTSSGGLAPMLMVVDLTDPRNPVPFSSMVLEAPATDVVLKDNTALVALQNKTLIIDLTEPGIPTLLGSIDNVGGRLTLNGFLYSTSPAQATGLHIAALGALAYVKSFDPKVIVVSPANELADNVNIAYQVIPPDPAMKKAEVHIDVQGGGNAATLPGSVDGGSGTVVWQSGQPVDPSKAYVATVHAQSNGAEVPTIPITLPLVGLPVVVDARNDRMLKIQFALPDQKVFVDQNGSLIDKYTVKVYFQDPEANQGATPAFMVTSADIDKAYPNVDNWFSVNPDGTGGDIQDGSDQGTKRWVTRKIDQFSNGQGLNGPIKMQAFEIGTVLTNYSSVFIRLVSEKSGKVFSKVNAVTSGNDNWAQLIQQVAGYVDEAPTPPDDNGVVQNSGMIYRVLHTIEQMLVSFGVGVVQGILDGFKDGAEGDVSMVGSIFDAVLHPVKTAIGLVKLVGKVCTALGQISFSGIIKSMYHSVGGVSWPTPDDLVMLAGKAGYFFGYLAGFILEQVVSTFIVAVISAGVGALAEKVLTVLKGIDWIANLAKDAAQILRVVGYWFEVLAKAGADSKLAKNVVQFLKDSKEAVAAFLDKYPGADKVLKKLAGAWQVSSKLAGKAFGWLETLNKMAEDAAERFVAFLTKEGEAESEALMARWLAFPNGPRSVKDAAEAYEGYATLSEGAADALTTAAELLDSDSVSVVEQLVEKYKATAEGDRVGSSLSRLRLGLGDTRYSDEAIGSTVKVLSEPGIVTVSDQAVEGAARFEQATAADFAIADREDMLRSLAGDTRADHTLSFIQAAEDNDVVEGVADVLKAPPPCN